MEGRWRALRWATRLLALVRRADDLADVGMVTWAVLRA